MDNTGSSNSVATASIAYTVRPTSTVPVLDLSVADVKLLVGVFDRTEPRDDEWYLLDRLEFWLKQVEGSRP